MNRIQVGAHDNASSVLCFDKLEGYEHKPITLHTYNKVSINHPIRRRPCHPLPRQIKHQAQQQKTADRIGVKENLIAGFRLPMLRSINVSFRCAAVCSLFYCINFVCDMVSNKILKCSSACQISKWENDPFQYQTIMGKEISQGWNCDGAYSAQLHDDHPPPDPLSKPAGSLHKLLWKGPLWRFCGCKSHNNACNNNYVSIWVENGFLW